MNPFFWQRRYHDRWGSLYHKPNKQRWFNEPFLSAVTLGGRRKSLSLLSQIASSAAGEPYAVFS